MGRINQASVALARKVADEYSTPSRPRYVVASVGPTNKTCSMSPDVSNPASRAITFDEMAEAYQEQFEALLQAGVDAILMETIFDSLNVKAGIWALLQAEQQTGIQVPLMLSATISDKAGRILSGQTLEAFLVSVAHAHPLTVGLNCSFGAQDMLSPLRVLAEKADTYISVHPNAGLPNSQADSNAEDMTTTLTHSAARKTTTVRKLWKRVAAVAACVAVIGIGTTAYLAQQDNKPAADEMANTSTTEEQYYDDYVDEVADFAMLDNTDIIACMSEE